MVTIILDGKFSHCSIKAIFENRKMQQAIIYDRKRNFRPYLISSPDSWPPNIPDYWAPRPLYIYYGNSIPRQFVPWVTFIPNHVVWSYVLNPLRGVPFLRKV